ncbi:hypothetical protein [Halostella litorea]|uniref:hypothetical protein n=1 Tax=Halostella litorea TaxID=2528831 RepID=UPI00192A384A|nr:hypothetical protein [Halostella litorea]
MAATYDIVVDGGGTADRFAPTTAADEGVDVAPLERPPGAAGTPQFHGPRHV